MKQVINIRLFVVLIFTISAFLGQIRADDDAVLVVNPLPEPPNPKITAEPEVLLDAILDFADFLVLADSPPRDDRVSGYDRPYYTLDALLPIARENNISEEGIRNSMIGFIGKELQNTRAKIHLPYYKDRLYWIGISYIEIGEKDKGLGLVLEYAAENDSTEFPDALRVYKAYVKCGSGEEGEKLVKSARIYFDRQPGPESESKFKLEAQELFEWHLSREEYEDAINIAKFIAEHDPDGRTSGMNFENTRSKELEIYRSGWDDYEKQAKGVIRYERFILWIIETYCKKRMFEEAIDLRKTLVASCTKDVAARMIAIDLAWEGKFEQGYEIAETTDNTVFYKQTIQGILEIANAHGRYEETDRRFNSTFDKTDKNIYDYFLPRLANVRIARGDTEAGFRLLEANPDELRRYDTLFQISTHIDSNHPDYRKIIASVLEFLPDERYDLRIDWTIKHDMNNRSISEEDGRERILEIYRQIDKIPEMSSHRKQLFIDTTIRFVDSHRRSKDFETAWMILRNTKLDELPDLPLDPSLKYSVFSDWLNRAFILASLDYSSGEMDEFEKKLGRIREKVSESREIEKKNHEEMLRSWDSAQGDPPSLEYDSYREMYYGHLIRFYIEEGKLEQAIATFDEACAKQTYLPNPIEDALLKKDDIQELFDFIDNHVPESMREGRAGGVINTLVAMKKLDKAARFAEHYDRYDIKRYIPSQDKESKDFFEHLEKKDFDKAVAIIKAVSPGEIENKLFFSAALFRAINKKPKLAKQEESIPRVKVCISSNRKLLLLY